MSFNLSTGSTTIQDSLQLNLPKMPPTSRRACLLKEGLNIGKKSASSCGAEYRTCIIAWKCPPGPRVNSWLNDSGDVIKEEFPNGYAFLKEPKFEALSGSEEGPELLSAVSFKIIGTMPYHHLPASSISYLQTGHRLAQEINRQTRLFLIRTR